jgi:hypothetical protein
MYLERTLSLVKVYVDFAGQASDVDYLNMVGELQQSEVGSQRAVDCSCECCVWDDVGLCILKQLLLLLFDVRMGQWARSMCHSVSGRRAGRLPRLSRIVFVVCLHQLSKCDTVYPQVHT